MNFSLKIPWSGLSFVGGHDMGSDVHEIKICIGVRGKFHLPYSNGDLTKLYCSDVMKNDNSNRL